MRTKPKWRNWQTRQVQDLVPVKGVEVRVLSSAFIAATMPTQPITALGIKPTQEGLVLLLQDRSITVPWEKCSEKLATASETARMEAELSPGGYGIHWPLLDEDLSVQGLIKTSENGPPPKPGSH
jgi:Protein of unknown function (DUF2442)